MASSANWYDESMKPDPEVSAADEQGSEGDNVMGKVDTLPNTGARSKQLGCNQPVGSSSAVGVTDAEKLGASVSTVKV